MFKYGLTIIVILGLVACGDTAEDHKAVRENTEVLSPDKHVDAAKDVIKKPLDLDLPAEEKSTSVDHEDFSEQKILPDFFNPEEQEQNTVISGKLLNDPSNPDYVDSIEGAEVSVKMKMD